MKELLMKMFIWGMKEHKMKWVDYMAYPKKKKIKKKSMQMKHIMSSDEWGSTQPNSL